MEDKVIVTTINGVGVAQAKNDLATFVLTLRTKSEELENAKRQLEEKISEARNVLSFQDMQLENENEVDVSRSNFKLEHREGAERYAAGFQCVATITWTMKVDSRLDDVYKTCLKLDSGVTCPVFSIKNSDGLQVEALQKAMDHAKMTLEKECSLLDISPKDLQILNWNIGYNGQLAISSQTVGDNYLRSLSNGMSPGVMGATGPMGLMGSQGQIGSTYEPAVQKLGSIYQESLDYRPLNPGVVTVTVRVQIKYVWKN